MFLIYALVVALVAIVVGIQIYYSQEQTVSEAIPVPISDHKNPNHINGRYLK